MSPSTPPDSALIASATTLRAKRSRFGRQPLSHPIDQRTAHAARLSFCADGCAGSTREYPRAAAASAERRPNRRPPCSSCSARRGAAHRRQQRHPGDGGHFVGLQPTRRRAPHHQTDVGVDRGQHRNDRRGRRAGPHIARADHDHQVGCFQRCFDGVGQPARKVAYHRCSAAAPGVQHGLHCARRPIRNLAGSRTARLTPRCRGSASRTAAQLSRPPCSARSGQRTPGVVSAPTSRSIPPPHGIEVDQHRIGGRQRERGRKERRTRTTASADHRQHRAAGTDVAS